MPRAATEDALDQLDRTHRRHDQALAALLEAAGHLAAGRAGPGDLDDIGEAIAYFERAVPRHFADEEDSLFPRLDAALPARRGDLDRLRAEHTEHLADHARLRELFDGWGADVPGPDDAAALLAVAQRHAATHRRHVELEDELFAEARAALSPEALTAIADEMDARRGRGGGGGGGGGGGRRRG